MTRPSSVVLVEVADLEALRYIGKGVMLKQDLDTIRRLIARIPSDPVPEQGDLTEGKEP